MGVRFRGERCRPVAFYVCLCLLALFTLDVSKPKVSCRSVLVLPFLSSGLTLVPSAGRGSVGGC